MSTYGYNFDNPLLAKVTGELVTASFRMLGENFSLNMSEDKKPRGNRSAPKIGWNKKVWGTPLLTPHIPAATKTHGQHLKQTIVNVSVQILLTPLYPKGMKPLAVI